MKNLTKKLITLILTVSMFFGTGVTNVFAFDLSRDDIVLDNSLEEDVDVVRQIIDIYKLLYSTVDEDQSIERVRANITVNMSSSSLTGINLIIEIGSKITSLSEITTIIPKDTDLPDLVLESGNKIEFVNGTFDPAMNYKDSEGNDIDSSNVDLINQINIEAVNLLKNYKTNVIEPVRNYLLDLSKLTNIYLENYDTNGLKTNIITDYDANFLYILDNIDFTKITYGDDTENPVLDLTDAVDTESLDPDVITKIPNLQNVLNSFISLYKNIELFDTTKQNFEANNDVTGMLEYQKLIGKFNEATEKSFNENDLESFQSKIEDFYDKLKEKLDDTLGNIQAEYNDMNLNYTNDTDREIVNNKLTDLSNKLFVLSTIAKSTKLENADLETFTTDFLSEYDKSKLSVDNTLASLKINGIKLDVSKEYQELYLPSEVTTLDIEAILSSPKSTISIVKPTTLSIGENTVKIVVTSESGSKREYTIIVVRKEKEKTEEKVTFMNNTISNSDTDNNTISSIKLDNEKNKYKDNEIVDEKLSGWTVLLIVTGIGLIAFGVYLLFGDKATPLIVKKSIVKPRNVKNTKVVKKGKIINKSSKSKK